MKLVSQSVSQSVSK